MNLRLILSIYFSFSLLFGRINDELPPYNNVEQTRLDNPDLYWEWNNNPRWLSGVDWGGATFFESIGYGDDFLGSSLTSEDAIDVEIRLDSSETTFCQTYRRDLGYAASGVGEFRGSAWDISDADNPRRLNICFVEWDDGTGEHDPNLLWDPDNSQRGRREYLLIMMSDYDGNGLTYDDENVGYDGDVIYGWWPKLESAYSFFETNPVSLTIQLAYITNFTGLAGDGEVILNWEFEEDGVDYFELHYSLENGSESFIVDIDADDRSFIHTDVENHVEISYQIYGINNDGDILYKSKIIYATPSPLSLNMNLLGTWDELSTYGDIWGYTDPNTGKEYALLCARDDGLSIIDITGNPVQVGFIPAYNSSSDAKDVKVYEQYAILIKEREPAQVIDLSDPENPVEVSTIHFGLAVGDGGAHNCYVDGNYLYVVGHDEGGVQIFDLTNIEDPELAGFYSTYYYHDIYVKNGTAYAAGIYGDGVDILDVSNLNSIELLVNFNYDGSGAHNCWTTEDGNYLIVGDEIGDGPWNRIFNIQDYNNIELVAEIIVNENAVVHNSYVKDNLLYIGHYTEGVRIYDLTNPEQPHEIAYYDTYRYNDYGYLGCWSLYPYFDSGKIIASDMQSGLFILEHEPSLSNVEELNAQSFQLKQNYPNPFNPITKIDFTIEISSMMTLSIYDLKGKLVKELLTRTMPMGSHSITWNGKDTHGNVVPTGIYFYVLTDGISFKREKMILLK